MMYRPTNQQQQQQQQQHKNNFNIGKYIPYEYLALPSFRSPLLLMSQVKKTTMALNYDVNIKHLNKAENYCNQYSIDRQNY